MAFIRMDIFSKMLMRTVPVTCIVPVDNVRYEGEQVREPEKPYKTLYLLNGLYGNNMDWTLASDIFTVAQENNLVVIMPAGENKFYVDNAATGEAYGRFIGQELVELTRKLFPLSKKREDTFIGGLSMGAYGAMRNGLKYAETFGYIISLSAAFVCKDFVEKNIDEKMTMYDYTRGKKYFTSIFGDLDTLEERDMDCKTLFNKNLVSGIPNPKIYQACGTEDFLIKYNYDFREFLKSKNADFVYDEGPGEHDFRFWNKHLLMALKWLPLEETMPGISSGNVKR